MTTYPDWVTLNNWTTIYDWMHGGVVDAVQLQDELRNALGYDGGGGVKPTKGHWKWPPK